MSCGCQTAVSLVSAPALTAAPAYTQVQAAPAYTQAVAVQAAPVAAVAAVDTGRWADYSPNPIQLTLPALPAPDYRCYQAPQIPQGQNRFLNVNEPGQVRNLQQNFNDVRTAVRENNTHVQRNRTQVTNVNRNHNHLLRIVTNENNYEHNLLNQVVRVADIHRQRIENVRGQTRQFRDYKTTQRVENGGCRRADCGYAVQAAPVAVQAAPVAYTQAAPVAYTQAAPVAYTQAAQAVAYTQAAPAYTQAAPAYTQAAPAYTQAYY